MSNDPEILMRKGKPWFSYGAMSVAGAALLLGAGFYYNTKESQADLNRRLTAREQNDTAREENDKKTAEALTSIAIDLRGLRYDVNDALLDRWTGTDMKFLWVNVGTFWSEFRRLNPTLAVPPWPEARRVQDNDGH